MADFEIQDTPDTIQVTTDDFVTKKFYEANRIEKENKILLSKVKKSWLWRDVSVEQVPIHNSSIILRIQNSRPSRVFCIPNVNYVIYKGSDYDTKESFNKFINQFIFETEEEIISVGQLTHWAYIPEIEE